MRWDRVVAGMGEAAKYLYVTQLVTKGWRQARHDSCRRRARGKHRPPNAHTATTWRPAEIKMLCDGGDGEIALMFLLEDCCFCLSLGEDHCYSRLSFPFSTSTVHNFTNHRKSIPLSKSVSSQATNIWRSAARSCTKGNSRACNGSTPGPQRCPACSVSVFG